MAQAGVAHHRMAGPVAERAPADGARSGGTRPRSGRRRAGGHDCSTSRRSDVVGHQQRAGRGAHEHLDPAAAGQPLQLAQGAGVLVRARRHRRRGRSACGRRPGRACRPSASASVVVGSVFGISNTAVTPPSTAAREPLSRSSFHSRPGSRKCTWVSMTPGSTVRPGGVEHLAGRGLRQVADRGDAAAAHADVGQAAAGVVHHLAAAHDQVEGLRHRARRLGGGLLEQRFGRRHHAVGREVDHVPHLGAERMVDLAGSPRRSARRAPPAHSRPRAARCGRPTDRTAPASATPAAAASCE